MRIFFKKIILLTIVATSCYTMAAADLPSKGKKPPTQIYGAPGPLPPGPGAPIGGGSLLLLGMATLYGIKKYKNREQD